MENCKKADTHVHTKYSGFTKYSNLQFPDSISEPVMVVKAAILKGIDVLCVTDHNSITGALKAKKAATDLSGIDVVIGEEIATAEGEIIGLFLQEQIVPGLDAQETIEQIHEQGGIAVAPHPFSPFCPCLGDKVLDLNLEGVEVFNAIHRPYSNILALKKSKFYGKAIIGGSDAHTIRMVGNGYTTFSGCTGDDLRAAILRKDTSFGGKITPLVDCIRWSIGSAFEVGKASYRTLRGNFVQDDVLHARVDRIKKHNKIIGIISSAIYLVPPVPIMSGLIGDVITRRRSKLLWDKNNNIRA